MRSPTSPPVSPRRLHRPRGAPPTRRRPGAGLPTRDHRPDRRASSPTSTPSRAETRRQPAAVRRRTCTRGVGPTNRKATPRLQGSRRRYEGSFAGHVEARKRVLHEIRVVVHGQAWPARSATIAGSSASGVCHTNAAAGSGPAQHASVKSVCRHGHGYPDRDRAGVTEDARAEPDHVGGRDACRAARRHRGRRWP